MQYMATRSPIVHTLLLVLSVSCLSCATSRLSKSGQKKIHGKTFVIIGASSGFGRGVAMQLGQYRANVVLAARRTYLLDSIAADIRIAGGTALVVTTDISKPEEVQRLADMAVKHYGKVDVWINDAGVGAIGRFWDIPLEDQARVVDVNLKGVIYGTYAALKIFRSQQYGTIINVGSIDSETPLAYQGSYSATKAGVRSLGNALNQELRLNKYRRIKVVTIEPWATDTPWWRHAANYSGGTPRMALIDPPRKVVNAIIWSSIHRRKELQTGWKARSSYMFHRMFPHFTERLSANVAHKYQIKTAPPAPPTQGSIYDPMSTGTGIDDGVKERIKRENKEREEKNKN
jgi:short-subunit dehydrogenase